MNLERIDSTQNQRLKGWIRLLRSAAARRESGEMVLEGPRIVAEALGAGQATVLLLQADRDDSFPLAREAERLGVEVVALGGAVFRKLSGVPSPQGVACVARMTSVSEGELFLPRSLLLVACGVQDPGNLGTMMRSAAATGCAGLVALPPSADISHPRTARASAGAVLRLPALSMSEEALLAAVRRTGMRLLAALPQGGSDYRTVSYGRPVAVVVGSEAHGIPAAIADRAEPVTIPMAAGTESLNAAVAASLLLFEAARRG